MSLFDRIFGGTDSKALDAQAERNTETAGTLAELSEKARQDIIRLFPNATKARSQGLEGAFNILSSVIPEQARVFSEGNQQAQTTQAMGLTGMNRALLGLPLDLRFSQTQNAVQPIDFNLTPEMIQSLMPEFSNPTQGIQQRQTPGNIDIAQLLSGIRSGGF